MTRPSGHLVGALLQAVLVAQLLGPGVADVGIVGELELYRWAGEARRGRLFVRVLFAAMGNMNSDETALTQRVTQFAHAWEPDRRWQAVQPRSGIRSPPVTGLRVGDEAGHATSSIASHGAAATAVGVSPANALTSRWRWDWST